MDESHNKEVGRVGEDTACQFLMKQGYSIVDRNYLKKWGEIDIVAKKQGIMHFVEVKTVSREITPDFDPKNSEYRPEGNVHPWKLQRMSRVIQTYILDKKIEDLDWTFDVVAVYLDLQKKIAKVEMLSDVLL
ncbi:YraN family protein [Candidatus Parcubacteria bacterium]|nr:YraN family protein [Candidatus Parcubacteria bacterium]